MPSVILNSDQLGSLRNHESDTEDNVGLKNELIFLLAILAIVLTHLVCFSLSKLFQNCIWNTVLVKFGL